MSYSAFISKQYHILLIASTGLVLTVLFYLIQQQILAGIGIIMTGTLLLGALISADAKKNARPIILADLAPNHREIILENTGTKAADRLEITAAGIDEPWYIDRLEPDTTTRLSLPKMVESLIVEVTYQVEDSPRKSKAFRLGMAEPEQDPFKPVFPLFSWKGK
ncbi:MAG TPA: hypothetical protein PK024_02365 [Methanospirillum sp.]|uniref:hypothetical protein n=1 Tax=Methanospirillum sp. TaxID=45200 RepID=UPI002CEDAC44|nr:hypothetical protein [Methanospirillum sp.]HOJ95671.1 hypothetical protein [Methanospirillum sp.]HPP77809.1 hypothetical protein [Methanospirillum sp.]